MIGKPFDKLTPFEQSVVRSTKKETPEAAYKKGRAEERLSIKAEIALEAAYYKSDSDPWAKGYMAGLRAAVDIIERRQEGSYE